MTEQMSLLFKKGLTAAIASDIAHEERATKDRTGQMPPKDRIENTGGRIARRSSLQGRQAGLTKLTVLLCQVMLGLEKGLSEGQRAKLLSHMALVEGADDGE